jgi:hypothetical protein
MYRIGLLLGFRGTLSSKSFPRYRLRGLKMVGAAALVFVLAVALQGCSDSSRQSSEFAYGNASDYATYGYNDPFAYGPYPYDPLLYSYWYPQPYYYRDADHDRDYDHDCDDGNCGARSGGHRLPSPIHPRLLDEQRAGAASRPLTTTREFSGGGFSSGGGNGSTFHGGFNGTGGFGSSGGSGFHSGFNGAGGFSGAGGFGSHGSGHR